MSSAKSRAAIAIAAIVSCLFGAEGFAQELQAPRDSAETRVVEGDAALALALRLLIQDGDYAAALALLDAQTHFAQRADVKRLRAQLLVEVGRERDAIALLESHLTQSPGDALARFQIAELHFASHRDGAAQLAYQLSLAGDLDDVRQGVARARLHEIIERRIWRTWAGVSIAPDTNLNGATDAARVELFGLPFDLSDEARRQSGVALSTFVGVERRFRLDETVAWRAAIVGAATETSADAFDTQFVSMRLGPEWRLGNDVLTSVQASGSRRWMGGELFETGAGVQAQAEFGGGGHEPRWLGAVRVERIDALINEARDGWVYDSEFVRTRFLGPASLWRLSAGAVQRDAELAAETYREGRLSAGYLRALPWSVLVYGEAQMKARAYGGAAAAFGEVRQDWEYGLTARFSKRDWVLFSAFPFVALSVTRAESTIPLNEFARERIELGFTREF